MRLLALRVQNAKEQAEQAKDELQAYEQKRDHLIKKSKQLVSYAPTHTL